jgi:hypothetical protein
MPLKYQVIQFNNSMPKFLQEHLLAMGFGMGHIPQLIIPGG